MKEIFGIADEMNFMNDFNRQMANVWKCPVK